MTTAIERGLVRGARIVALGLMLAAAPAAFAQMGTGIPSGSPLGGGSGSSSERSERQNTESVESQVLSTNPANPYVEQQSIQPYVIGQPLVTPYGSSSTNNGVSPLLQMPNNGVMGDRYLTRQPPKPGEFEAYVERILGRKLPRFGTSLILPAQRDFAAPATATVPPDYVVQPGDTIVVALAGSMSGSIEQDVDNSGRLFIRGVGPVHVAGVRHADLRGVIARAIGTQFRGFTVSVNIRRLRGIRVYVTGLANNPGAFTVGGLSTLANAVFQAGGPSAGGSWRSIKLYRNGQEVTDFDLYQLMRGGRRVNDVQLQNEDVLFIPPAGEQVAVIGSVQEEAIYEAKPGESLDDMLAAAGGPNTVADRSRMILYRTGDSSQSGPRQIDLATAGAVPIKGGDILQMLSAGTLTMPIDRQSVLVRVDGEVQRPGIFFVPPGTPISEVVAQAGGLTPRAYPFGTKFTRQSVKLQQQESFGEALRQLELSLAAAPLSADSSLSAAERENQISGARAVLERLRKAEPEGRVVLQLPPTATGIPGEIPLENNDAIYVPPLATTIGVFGAVYRPASFLVDGSHAPLRVRDYVEKSGGTLRAADKGSVFLVRANGEVVSKRRGALSARVLPGDIVFVPVKTQGNAFWAKFKDITQTLFQIGVSAASVATVIK